MKKLSIIAVVLCLALLPAFALADSTLRVQGSATLTVAPDMAVLGVGYSAQNESSAKAQQETADAIAAVVEALLAKDIADADIVTAYLNTSPVYDYSADGQKLLGYRAEHMLSVTVRDMDSVGDILDVALQAGANQSGSIEYRSSKESEVYLQALAKAIENATAKADAMVVATGMWLGGLEEVNEVAGYATLRYGVEAQYDDGAGKSSIGSTLRAGELSVTATVELVYEIR